MNINTIPWGHDDPGTTSENARKETWGFWQNRINRASLVMLADENIISREVAHTIALAQVKAEELQAKNLAEGGAPVEDIMPLEKMLIAECGQTASLIHTGRSRQDIFSTLNQARLRTAVLDLSEELNTLRLQLLELAKQHVTTWMPAYTNGVQAMPITFGFYLWAFLESFERDADRLRELYDRVNRSALGAAVMANSAWPLSRESLAKYLGFKAPIVNSLDAAQLSLFDIPLEAASVAANIANRISVLLADIAQQYAQTRPWLLLDQSQTYGSSAMPQKRNPGVINKARAKAGDVVGALQTCFVRAHNLPLGMYDNKESVTEDNSAIFVKAVHMLRLTQKTFEILRVDKARALEELNNDWTCSMALAETLQMKSGVPFREGHTFASEIVTVARKEGYLPLTFPYDRAQEIYRTVTEKLTGIAEELPITEHDFRETLTPELVVRTRTGTGSPAPGTVENALKNAVGKRVAADMRDLEAERKRLALSAHVLDIAFEELLAHPR